MAKGRGRQRKRIRKRKWDPEKDIDAAIREPRRMRGRETGIESPVVGSFDSDSCFSEFTPNGLVVSPYGVLSFVAMEEKEILCRVDDDLTDGKTSILAPGDEVQVTWRNDEPFVTAVRHRRSKLSRPDIHSGRERVFAANVDLLVIVASAVQPRFKQGVVDRY